MGQNEFEEISLIVVDKLEAYNEKVEKYVDELDAAGT